MLRYGQSDRGATLTGGPDDAEFFDGIVIASTRCLSDGMSQDEWGRREGEA